MHGLTLHGAGSFLRILQSLNQPRNSSTFYAALRFNTMFTSFSPHPVLCQDESNTHCHTLLLQIYFNIILPSMSVSPKWSLHIRCFEYLSGAPKFLSWNIMNPKQYHISRHRFQKKLLQVRFQLGLCALRRLLMFLCVVVLMRMCYDLVCCFTMCLY